VEVKEVSNVDVTLDFTDAGALNVKLEQTQEYNSSADNIIISGGPLIANAKVGPMES
jgi:hypothetical protein